MKININKQTLSCKGQHLFCDSCLFEKTTICIDELSILNKLCTKFDIIFVKHSSSDIFNL